MTLDARIGEVTERIRRRSKSGRSQYLDQIAAAAERKPSRTRLSCSNLAHGFAACGPHDKAMLRGEVGPNLGIVTAYNDMLSAHQPYGRFPDLIKEAARAAGGTAQVAGGVPAMCDGVTQGRAGMELSLFSRDAIAMAAAIGLSHDMFDAAVFLGICDKIVPGLLIASLTFGHLPAVFIPAGPMPSGVSNTDRSKARQLYAERKITPAQLLDVEAGSYHAPGTCTFYGTANSNQMLMEIMGLHIPGATFVNPDTPLRDALTRAATARALAITALGNDYTPVGADRRRAGDRQRRRRPARHRRLDQPHAPPRRHRQGGRHPPHLGRLRRPLRDRAAPRPRLPQRLGRREPVPSGRRDAVPDPRPPRRRPPPRGREDGVGHRPRRLRAGAEARRRRQCRLGRRPRGEPRRGDPPSRRARLLARGRAEAPRRQSRPRRDQGLGGEARASGGRGAGA